MSDKKVQVVRPRNGRRKKQIVSNKNEKQVVMKKSVPRRRLRNDKGGLLGSGAPQAKREFNGKELVGRGYYGKDRAVWEKWVKNFQARGPSVDTAGKSAIDGGLFTENNVSNSKIEVQVNAETAIGIGCGIISHALNHGWRTQCMKQSTPDFPYYAFVFIYDTVINVMEGNQANVPKVEFPDFLLEILAAVQPKMGQQVGSGTVGYSWTVTGYGTPTNFFSFPANSVAYGKYAFGTTSSSIADGFNTITLTAPGYTLEKGTSAFQSLINFMNGRLKDPTKKYRPYAKRTFDLKGTVLERSPSAFSSSNMVIGGGVSGGFAYSLAALETSIKHPKFAVFADPSQKLARGFRNYRAAGGDTTWLVCSIMEQCLRSEFSNPNYAAFKPVDFYEIADRLCLVIVSLFNKYYADLTVKQTIVDLGLTPSHFLVILRKTLMYAFGATQYGVQSLRFYPNSQPQDDFIPFLCAVGTSSSDAPASMILPLYMVENLNALRGRATWNNVNPRTGGLVKKNPKHYVPVLGQYQKYAFDPKVYNYYNGEALINIFAAGAYDDISMVDGTFSGTWYDLDLSPIIATDLATYNRTMNILGPYTQSPTTFNGDGGVNVLTVIADTYLVLENVQKSKDKKISKDKEKGRKQLSVMDKKFTARISMQPPYNDINMIKKAFVNPEYRLQTSTGGVGTINTETMKTLNLEMNEEVLGVPFTVGNNSGAYADAADSRIQFVSLCTKNKDAADDTIVRQISSLTEAGQAGLLGSLVQTFGGVLTNTAAMALNAYIPYV